MLMIFHFTLFSRQKLKAFSFQTLNSFLFCIQNNSRQIQQSNASIKTIQRCFETKKEHCMHWSEVSEWLLNSVNVSFTWSVQYLQISSTLTSLIQIVQTMNTVHLSKHDFKCNYHNCSCFAGQWISGKRLIFEVYRRFECMCQVSATSVQHSKTKCTWKGPETAWVLRICSHDAKSVGQNKQF